MSLAQQSPVEIAYFDGQIGKRIRVAAEYGNTWRPMFWIEVEKEGSLYCNFRLIDPKEGRTGVIKISNGQPVKVKYGDGTLVNPSLLDSAKVSVHGSGVSNSLGTRFTSLNLRELNEQKQLALLLFRHPGEFAPIAKVRKFDVCLRYPFDEERPMLGHLFISPKTCFVPVLERAALKQVILAFEFTSTNDIPDLTVQLSLSHSVEGFWPTHNTIVFENISE